ncbi:DUF1657 domain-containing protein [Virgibacillus ndiopensis]|uniref:DUF1657 domain-containing protein n=1 Tax=Virgibacillus ndiopensis TaxID=2004408 RepID=UPI000C07A9BD|nr:DUF1657 domain-containing protein [Virgibacillus ndiopensis]
MTVGSQVKSCYSSLKSADAQLGILANKAQDQETRQTYQDVQNIISEIKEDLQKEVIRIGQEEPQYKN